MQLMNVDALEFSDMIFVTVAKNVCLGKRFLVFGSRQRARTLHFEEAENHNSGRRYLDITFLSERFCEQHVGARKVEPRAQL